MTQLDITLHQQKIWSSTANALKARYDGARRVCFALSITAALLAAIASQLPDPASDLSIGRVREWLSVLSAVLLSLVGLLTLRFIAGQNTAWVRARSASEALKRIAWTYAAHATPYEDSSARDGQVAHDRQAIESGIDDLLQFQVAPAGDANRSKTPQPSETTTRVIYTKDRVLCQCNWYATRAAESKSAGATLRWCEFMLAAIAAVLTAVIGVLGKTKIATLPIDFVALTGVITTVSGAVLAYIEASKLDFLVTAYRAASRQLTELLAAAPDDTASSDKWSDYVVKVENIMATENGAWMAKLGKADDSR